jgi:two-component system nitrogen regulation response regulator NtrX
MPIAVPPLRDRVSDIPLLVRHFARVLGSGPGMTPKEFSADAFRALQKRHWVGNVRELRNAVERLLILSPGAEITGADVQRVLPTESAAVDLDRMVEASREQTFQEFKDEAERSFLLAHLRAHYWNVAETARVLGIPRSNLYNKIEKYQLERGH